MAYLWTSTHQIQIYLDSCGTLQIDADGGGLEEHLGDTLELPSAEQFENEAVYEVATFLSMAFKSTAASDGGVYSATPLGFGVSNCPNYLKLLVAKYTAAKIGMTRFGASLATLPNWVREFENDVMAQLQRLVINATTVVADFTGLALSDDYDADRILIKMKPRGRTVMETID